MSDFVIVFSTKSIFNRDDMPKHCDTFQNIVYSVELDHESFILELHGEKEAVLELVRNIWELASLYDGYFYKPENYTIDGTIQNVDDLYFLSFYRTGEIWTNFARNLVGTNRDFSAKKIKTYKEFHSRDREVGELNKTLINSLFYLQSKKYDGINVNHRLSLFLNLCDGLAINFYGSNNVNSSMSKILKKTLASEKVKYGASLFGIPKERLYSALSNERNEIGHYIIKVGSLSEYEMKAPEPIKHYLYFYFTYIVELAARIAILKEIGCECDKGIVDDVLDNINDWVIYNCNIDVECVKDINKLKQRLKKMGIDMR